MVPFGYVMVPLHVLILSSEFLRGLQFSLTDSTSAVDEDAISFLTADYWSVSRAQAHWPGEQGNIEGLRSRDLNKPQ